MDTEDTCNGHGMNMDTTQNGQGAQKEWTRNTNLNGQLTDTERTLNGH